MTKTGNLEKSSLKHPRLVVTASSVHDPDTPGGNVGPGATLGDLKGFVDFLEQGQRFAMVDGGAYDADKAYKDSKLLNVLFTEEMTRRLEGGRSRVTCNCFSPGLIPSTGLFRSQNPVFTKLFDFLAVQVLGVGTTPSVGGDTMVYMVESPELEETRGKFYATPPGKPRELFGAQQISKEAQDAAKAQRVWELSEKLLDKVLKQKA
jgi:protochlorophyllide reductase